MLQIKKEYKGKIIEKRFVGIGTIRLNTNLELSQEKMKHYQRNGFDEVFEIVEEENKVEENKPSTRGRKKK